MGKKSKVGKQRKDKFYHLAKETGYRSRAAFKLIQLNRKFGFLHKSRVCIDLCAAPGGWMQVAQQNMPLSSIVVGVDLFPIKPVPGCIGLTEDITTDKCKAALTKELQTWKADVVLNDGAPNVGVNWIHDAYQQTCLTLSALKLATEFLRKDGWFITKVFRSKDYDALTWVLKQLFKKVHATKPQASRTESAEIFVVCQHYLAPDKIDPKLLDPKYVFEELNAEKKTKLVNLLHPERQKKARAVGYPENDYTLYHPMSVLEFINKDNVVEALQSTSAIIFDHDGISNHPKTLPEIKECCKDIKVLGRKDLRSLIAWWKAMKEFINPPKPEEVEEEPEKPPLTAEEQEEQEYKDMMEKVSEVQAEEAREMKRKRKRILKERVKLNERMNLKMVIKGDTGPTEETDDLFQLKTINDKQVNMIDNQKPDVVAESDTDSDEEPDLKRKKAKYNIESTRLDSSGLYYKDSDSELEMDSGSDAENDKEGLGFSESDDETPNIPVKKAPNVPKPSNSLLVDLDRRDAKTRQLHKAELWFQKDSFKNFDDEADENVELNQLERICEKKGGKVIGSQKYETAKDQPDDSDSTDSDSDYDMEKVRRKSKKGKSGRGGGDSAPVEEDKELSKLKKFVKMDAEGMALSTLLATSRKQKRDIIDAAWNRYTFNDDNLPDWFVEDEKKHMKKDIPVPEDLVNEYKGNLKEINVRPIKKVMEAKARKKKRAINKLQKAKKKIEALMDNEDVGNREKAKQIKQLYRKATATKKTEVTYVVARKHNTERKVKRPKGVKGIYKVVDPRMKKDLRAMKAKEKTLGRKKGAKKNFKPKQNKPKPKKQRK